MSDPRFPPSVSDSSRTILTSTGLKGDTGEAATYIVLQSPVVPIPCDNDGSNPVYSANVSEVYILKAGVVLTGWTLAYVSGTNCVGQVNNSVEPRTAEIGSITGDTGYAIFTAAKSGEVTQTFRLYFSRQKAGVQGATGSTGSTGSAGSTGSTGAAGSDGTGLVVVKKIISVDAPTVVTKQDYGDGNLQLNYPGAHGLLLGEYVRVLQTAVYDGGYPISEVVSSTSIKIDVAYDATAGTVNAFDMKHFQQISTNGPNLVGFKDIIPHGAKVLEWHIFYSNDNSGAIDTVSISVDNAYLGNLASMNGSWLSGHYFTAEGDLVSRDRRGTLAMSIIGDWDLFIQVIAGGGATPDDWDTEMVNFELEFFISYINYDPTWTP